MSLSPEEKERLFLQLDHIENRVSKVERGLYGDKDSALPGVISDMQEIKKFKSTVTKIGAGVSTLMTIAINAFIAFFRLNQH